MKIFNSECPFDLSSVLLPVTSTSDAISCPVFLSLKTSCSKVLRLVTIPRQEIAARRFFRRCPVPSEEQQPVYQPLPNVQTDNSEHVFVEEVKKTKKRI